MGRKWCYERVINNTKLMKMDLVRCIKRKKITALIKKFKVWKSSHILLQHCYWALEKEMGSHSSVLAWSIPGTGEPGGVPSVGSHRVGHDWSDLTAAAIELYLYKIFILYDYYMGGPVGSIKICKQTLLEPKVRQFCPQAISNLVKKLLN